MYKTFFDRLIFLREEAEEDNTSYCIESQDRVLSFMRKYKITKRPLVAVDEDEGHLRLIWDVEDDTVTLRFISEDKIYYHFMFAVDNERRYGHIHPDNLWHLLEKLKFSTHLTGSW